MAGRLMDNISQFCLISIQFSWICRTLDITKESIMIWKIKLGIQKDDEELQKEFPRKYEWV